MLKKTAFILAFSVLVIPLHPSVGMSWHYPHHSHHHHGDEALWWGLGGLLLGTFIAAATLPPPPPPRPPVVYAQPQTQVYSYPPYVPPGMCRWERFMLDGYGRPVLDQYGQPVKEYTLGSCQYPPN
jgi:hypothetical protein